MLTPFVGRRVLQFVLEQLFEDLAEARLVADRDHRLVRAVPADRVRAEEQAERLDRVVDRLDGIERRPRQPGQALATDRGEDRIDLAVEPAELVRRGVAPLGDRPDRAPGRSAASASRST